MVEDTLFQRDFINGQNDRCVYFTGQSVLLRRPDWHKKSLTPYERGWFVNEVTSPSTVVISNAVHGGQKTVYIDLLKPDSAADSSRVKRFPDSANDEVADQSGASVGVFLEMPDFADDGESGLQLVRQRFSSYTFSLFLVFHWLLFLCLLSGACYQVMRCG